MANPSGLVNLPSNIYAGGAVKLDTHPLMNFIAQTMYRNRIRDEAMDRYFTNLGNRLTPAGMHNNDVATFMQKKNAWQEYAMKNRNPIMHPNMDNGDASTTASEMYNDAQAHAQSSKDKVQRLMAAKSIMDDPQKRSLLTDQSLHDIQSGELPIDDPNYKPLDLSQLHYNPKPFSLQDNAQVENQFNKFKGTSTLDNTTKDATNLRLIDHYKTQFSKDELSGMAGLGSALYNGSPGFKQMIDSHAHPDDQMYGAINPTFKQHYGHDIGTPEEFATAYGLSLNGNAPPKDLARPDTQALNEQRANLALRNQKTMFNQRVNTKPDITAAVNKDVEDMYQSAKSSTQGDPTAMAYRLPVGQDVGNLFSRTVAGHKTSPVELHFSPDGSQVTPIYKAADGSVDETLSKPISREAFTNTMYGLKKYSTLKGTGNNTSTTIKTSNPKSTAQADKDAEDLINKYKNYKP